MTKTSKYSIHIYLNFLIKNKILTHCFLNSNKLQVEHLAVTIMTKVVKKSEHKLFSYLAVTIMRKVVKESA